MKVCDTAVSLPKRSSGSLISYDRDDEDSSMMPFGSVEYTGKAQPTGEYPPWL
jgi:hypothetical protein